MQEGINLFAANNYPCFYETQAIQVIREQAERYSDVPIGSSSEQEHKVNALASGAEEGRDKLRKATGRSKYPLIRRFPNEGTHMGKAHVSLTESNRLRKGTA